MLHQRGLQVAIISLHPLCSSSPWRNRAFRQRLRLVGYHQVGITNELGPETMTGGARAEMTVEGKMFWSQLTECKSALRVPVVRAITRFLPALGCFGIRRCR